MGNNNYDTTPASTPTPVKENKFPHVPVKNGSVKFYVVVDGKSGGEFGGEFVPQFEAKSKDGKLVLSNLSFTGNGTGIFDNEVAIDDLNDKYGPKFLTTLVYLTLDDFRTGKGIPLSDITGALAQ